MLRDTTVGAIADQSQTSDANPEPTHVALVSLDGTPGPAFQQLGTYEGSILATVDRRRLPVGAAVIVLRELYGADTEIAIGAMPAAVTR